MNYLLSIDPGMSTGIALGTYSATEPYRRIMSWQPRGGLAGFLEWWHDRTNHTTIFEDGDLQVGTYEIDIVCEKFVPVASGAFNFTVDALEPLRIEGALLALGLNPSWQRAASMYFMADRGDSLRVKRKKAQEWLKRYGLWAAGKEYGHTDGADVNSATLHALTYLRSVKHMPTLKAYFPPRVA